MRRVNADLLGVFPASAGMIPGPRTQASRPHRVPRKRGDDPGRFKS